MRNNRGEFDWELFKSSAGAWWSRWWWAILIFSLALPVALHYAGVSKPNSTSGECYRDWDGRSNPTVCD